LAPVILFFTGNQQLKTSSSSTGNWQLIRIHMTNLTIPSVGESITEVTLLRWTKNDGDYVSKGDPVAELETDKANADLIATASGQLHPAKPAGQVAKVGEVVAKIDESATPSAKPAPVSSSNGGAVAGGAASKTTAPGPTLAGQPAKPQAAKTRVATEDLSPSVPRMVSENKVDSSAISASGPGGRILKEDVQKYLDTRPREPDGKPALQPPVAPVPATRAPGPDLSKPTTEAPLVFDDTGTARVPMTKIRKRIAQNLLQAQQNAAILTTFNEIDLSGVSELRSKYKEKFEKTYGVGLGFMSFFARAVILALREFQRVNAFLDGDDVLYHNYVNLGIAVSTDRGLTVPILSNAHQMSFAKIESEIKRLATASREGKLGIQELSGGTFTITNGGVFGSLLSTPILNPPQSAILGMHAIQKRPMAVGDKIEIRPMMYVALSYDHRLVDGRESVSFLVRVKEYLEDPARLMLEI
jgi:2-oxoglutarate dehydrogenase E2 component (dihydrolipoamide succinyltransferase)